MKIASYTLLAVSLIFASHLSAEESSGSTGGTHYPRGEMKAKMIQKFDKNSDGQLNDSEKSAAKDAMKARRQARLAKFDADGDGKLSDTEKAAAKQACAERKAKREAHRAEILKKFDADGDGKLSDSEKSAAKAARAEHKYKAGGKEGNKINSEN